MKKTIFITGTSSGLGKVSAKYFAEQGWNVAATMRTPEKETELQAYPNIKLFKLDVTDVAQVRRATEEAIEAFGKIDVVLNNAGMGVYGALELATEEAIDRQLAVNARGPLNVIRGFLPHFRKQGGGMFINVSSFMGITTAVPLGSLYNMSKFALEGLIEGLYQELKPLNIELRLIEPGGFSGNNFQENLVFSNDSDITAYDTLTKHVQGLFANSSAHITESALDIVKIIESLANRESNQFRTVIGPAGNGLMNMRNSMPIEKYLDEVGKLF